MATRAAARGAASVVVLVSAAVMATPPARGAPQDRQPPKATRFGPETPIADQVMGSAPGDQDAPLIVAGAGGSLAVWSDGREFAGLDGIYASRLRTNGEVLDPMGLPISPPDKYSTDPSLAWNGQDYLVAWEEIGAGIQAARVTPEGAMLDAHRITVAAESDDVLVGEPAVASSGGRSLVVWNQCRFGRGCRRSVRGAFVEGDGSVGDSFRLVEGKRAGVSALAATEDGFLLTWEGGPCCHSNLFALALDAEGVPLGDSIRLAKYVAEARLAASGGTYLVAWGQELRNDLDVYGARLDPKGEVIDARPIRIASNAGRHFPASVAPGPDAGWTVVWSGGPHDRIFGSRLSASGDVSNENGSLLVDQRGREGLAGIAFTGDGWTLLWDASYRGPAADVYAAAGELEELRAEEPRLVSQAPNSQGGPDIASNGAVALVVWSDARGTPRDPGVYASRMTLDGRMLIGRGAPGGGQLAVATDGTDFFVTWDYPDRRGESDGGNIYGTRVSSAGEVLDPNPIVVTQARFTQRTSDVAWTGDAYLVVWQDYRHSYDPAANNHYPNDSADVFGARVSSDGTVVDPHGIALVDTGRSEVWPQIATGDDQLFLTWADDCVVADGPSCTQDVSGARLDVGATRVGAPMSIAASDVWESQPTITAVPDGYLVGWSTVDYGTGESAVAVRQVRTDGTMGSVQAMPPTQTSQHFPHLAWDGDAAVLAWTLNGECFYCSEDAAVIRLDETGSPLDDAPTTVTATDRGEVATSVASIRPGCTAIGYGRGDDPTVGVGRGYLRLFGKC